MKNNKATLLFIGLLVLVFAGLIGSRMWSETQPGPHDALAQCIADSGAKFYGAFWCPHCAEQKAAFGNSYKLLPYVECSTADKSGQTQECIDAKITGYPTWRFTDGTELSGKQSLEVLAAKTNCAAAEGSAAPATDATTTPAGEQSSAAPILETSVEIGGSAK